MEGKALSLVENHLANRQMAPDSHMDMTILPTPMKETKRPSLKTVVADVDISFWIEGKLRSEAMAGPGYRWRWMLVIELFSRLVGY